MFHPDDGCVGVRGGSEEESVLWGEAMRSSSSTERKLRFVVELGRRRKEEKLFLPLT